MASLPVPRTGVHNEYTGVHRVPIVRFSVNVLISCHYFPTQGDPHLLNRKDRERSGLILRTYYPDFPWSPVVDRTRERRSSRCVSFGARIPGKGHTSPERSLRAGDRYRKQQSVDGKVERTPYTTVRSSRRVEQELPRLTLSNSRGRYLHS